jgi:predicted nucleic acid-binding protein
MIRASLLTGCETMFSRVFAGRILPFSEEAARAFSQIAAERRLQGRPIAEFDAQIAAIARSRGAILATRNTTDFEGCAVRLVNPWLKDRA